VLGFVFVLYVLGLVHNPTYISLPRAQLAWLIWHRFCLLAVMVYKWYCFQEFINNSL